jgi:hypothetical protein
MPRLGSLALWAFLVPSFCSAANEPVAATLPRVEARSGDLLAVGVVRGELMSIHVSRLIDNAPVRDASLTVVLRGTAHPTVAEADGSYTLSTPDLALPGAAAVQFDLVDPSGRQSLKGTLEIAGAQSSEDKNSSRQLWWWVLNFAVCFGALWLFSRRRKASKEAED